MSELTQCNFCTLQGIKAIAKKNGRKVVVEKDDSYPLKGFNVYTQGKMGKHFEAWLMEISGECCC